VAQLPLDNSWLCSGHQGIGLRIENLIYVVWPASMAPAIGGNDGRAAEIPIRTDQQCLRQIRLIEHFIVRPRRS
jgi:hypothetical protein